ncbi:hypothetical protein [Opitutus terrae]|uniref:Uncharacterized protein n=1 Tax=Opitutus terrae (strain DSM 11246 / JCM 15787 / PB90-1) TaxID=452637 RepID=B1ZMP8_OPITP|nr:hypothetical protein [Opitutus terrae]ACB75326.1 hypothetical protein Oter_2043 [Opitutus terrae PB90-1]
MPDWLLIVCAAFPPTAAAVVGWWHLYFARRDKRIAEERQAKAEKERSECEKELREIRRRSLQNAPYFTLSETVLARIEYRPKPTRVSFLLTTSGNVLTAFREEVTSDMPDGTDVCLLVENRGADGLEVSANIDGRELTIFRALNQDNEHIHIFRYVFATVLRSQTQKISISFLGPSGVRDVHTYETKHGVRFLRRIDPA